MSLIYIENKVGPRIEPCGAPHLISFNEDFNEDVTLVHALISVGLLTFKQLKGVASDIISL